ARVIYTSTSTSRGGVTSLQLLGGQGGNTYNVYNTSDFYGNTYLQTGSGADRVNVLGTTGALYEYNRGGTNTTVIGNGGSTSAVRGEVHVNGYGATSLIVDDGADTRSLAVDLYDGSITGLAPAPIDYSPSSAN